jgi:hypothetical protein
MRTWDLDSSAAQVRRAMEDLQTAWNVVSESWNDSVSRQYSEQYLESLIPTTKMTLDAVARMRDLLVRLREECEE